MTKDDVLKFIDIAAKQALEQTEDDFGVTMGQLRERHFLIFAALVAAHEREQCAKLCLSLFDADVDSCNEAEQCAAAIRARGNQ